MVLNPPPPPSALPPLDDRVTISTPEGIELHMVLAGMGSRFVAALVDTILKTLITYGLIFVLVSGVGSFASSVSVDESGLWGISIGLFLLFIIQSFYDMAFEVLANGRTPGKRWSGLRVVMADGSPVTFRASAVRNLVRIVDFLPVSYLAGMTALLVTKRNQRIGDLFAGTLVIRDRRGGKAATAPQPPAPQQVHPAVMAWDTSSITAEELSTVRSFLERRVSLEPASRAQLAWELAARLYPKVAGAPGNLHPEYFLEALAAAKAARG